tara:strand:- start:793 stop:1131 length:339 start_codon:yes stop_codon:yes gene_type:complete
MHALAHAGNEESLGQTGDAHEEGVATGEEADGQLFDHLMLADDDFAQLVFERLVELSQLIDGSDIVRRQGIQAIQGIRGRRSGVVGGGSFGTGGGFQGIGRICRAGVHEVDE